MSRKLSKDVLEFYNLSDNEADLGNYEIAYAYNNVGSLLNIYLRIHPRKKAYLVVQKAVESNLESNFSENVKDGWRNSLSIIKEELSKRLH